mgnify:CR=1 FL=1
MTKPEPLPTPSTDHDLTNIDSEDYLLIWDDYVCAILQGSHASHGAHPSNVRQGATYIAEMADAMMAERQERAQGHIDQGIVEAAEEREARKAAKATSHGPRSNARWTTARRPRAGSSADDRTSRD